MNLSESTKINLDLKSLIMIIGFTVSMVSMYAKLQSDIQVAMNEPAPVISPTEFEMKDLLVRETIKNTLIATENNALALQEIKDKLNTLENRIYELKNQ